MIEDCHLINLPKIHDYRGNLTFIETGTHIPFEIKRIYYLYDTPTAIARGGHAHKELHQLFIAIAGSFNLHLSDGSSQKTIYLDKADEGFYVCPMIWRELDNFSPGAVCMVLASNLYSELDYYRNYADFLNDLKSK